MFPGQPVANVQESKAKRQERLKSRFRDRGGIFVPAEGNALAQLLLERGVNGETPSKRRSPRKPTAVARPTAPKSARSTKVATKTPRTASKRARKSIVVPGAAPADENTFPQSSIAPDESPTKRRSPRKPIAVRPTTPKSVRSAKVATKTPRAASKRARKSIVGPGADLADENTVLQPSIAPASTKKNKRRPTSKSKTTKSRSQRGPPHMKNVDFDGDNGGDFDVDPVPPLNSAGPSRSPAPVRPKPFADRLAAALNSADQRPLDLFSTSVKPSRLTPSAPSLEVVARHGRQGGDDDNSDLPLGQKLTKMAPAEARPKSSKRTGTKDARPPPARRKRAAPKAKADTKRTAVAADDADADEETKRTAKSAIAKTQTGGGIATEATAGREAPTNSRKRGAEEGRGHEEMAYPVAPPRVGEDVLDVVQPPTKRTRVLQEKTAPLKRKERTKNVDDDNDVRIVNNENENGPPTKKRRRADSQTATAVSRRRRGKENENGTEQSKSTRKASKAVMDKPLLSPAGAHRKPTSKGKPPIRARSRGLPPDVLRRIKVNARTLEAPQDIDDDDPIDFLRS